MGNSQAKENIVAHFTDYDVNKKEEGNESKVKSKKSSKVCLFLAVQSNKEIMMQYLQSEDQIDLDRRYGHGKTILHIAVARGNTEVVKLLLDIDAKVNVQDEEGMTPLHIAYAAIHFETIKLLIDYGANINIKDNEGNCPLHLAAIMRSYTDITSPLLDNGALIDEKNMQDDTPLTAALKSKNIFVAKLLIDGGADLHIQDGDGNLPLHLAIKIKEDNLSLIILGNVRDLDEKNNKGETPLLLALMHNVRSVASVLLERRADITVKDEEGNSPLHLAVRCGDDYIVKQLLNLVDNIEERNDHGLTPLIVSLKDPNSNPSICSMLLDRGADVNTTDNKGNTALHLSIKMSRDLPFRILKETLKWDEKNHIGETPFLLALRCRASDLALTLLELGATLELRDMHLNTPLHLAILTGNAELIRRIMEHLTDFEIRNDEGETPLLLALKHRVSCAVHMLSELNVNVDTMDNEGNTTLHWAVAGENPDIVTLISSQLGDMNVRNGAGETPLLFSIKRKYYHVHRFGFREHIMLNNFPNGAGFIDVCELLLGQGADINARDSASGYMLIHWAILTGSLSVVIYLMTNGADINSRTNSGETPLLFAMKRSTSNMAFVFLENGADVNVSDHEGNTALHAAVVTGNSALLVLVLTLTDNIEPRNNLGETPLQLSLRLGKSAIMYMLMSKGADINAQDNNGNTALHLEMMSPTLILGQDGISRFIKKMELMFAWGGSMLIRNNKGQTPLDIAASKPKVYNDLRVSWVYHNNLLRCAGIDVDVETIDDIEVDYDINPSRELELEQLKTTRVGQNTLYDVLGKYNDPTFLSNDELKKMIDCPIEEEGFFREYRCTYLEDKYDVFGALLRGRYNKAKKRLCLLNAAENFENFELQLPNEIKRQIFSYLDIGDLEAVVSCM